MLIIIHALLKKQTACEVILSSILRVSCQNTKTKIFVYKMLYEDTNIWICIRYVYIYSVFYYIIYINKHS